MVTNGAAPVIQSSTFSFHGELPVFHVQCLPRPERALDATTTKALARWSRLNDLPPKSPRGHGDPLQESAYYSHRSAHPRLHCDKLDDKGEYTISRTTAYFVH